MPLAFRQARARFGALALVTTSLLQTACAAGAAAEAPPAYYGGAAQAAVAPAAMPEPAPAPMAESRSESADEGFSVGSLFGGDKKSAADDDDAPAATPLPPPPVAPAPVPMASPGGMPARVPMATTGQTPPSRPAQPPPPPPRNGAGDKGTPAKPGKPGEGGTEQAQAQQEKPPTPLLIYTGKLGMEVPLAEDIPATIEKVIDIAVSAGGYLGSRTDTSVLVRVPSIRFRETLTTMEKLGDVKRRNVSAEDVSEEYHDLEVRLANLKAVQKRLQEFLAKAQGIPDALQVEHELERVGREIDQIEGRMRFLRARATFSTITVDLAAKPKQQVVAQGQNVPPPPRAIDLPIDWIARVGLDTLLNLRAGGDQ
jgi:hypothetical protein